MAGKDRNGSESTRILFLVAKDNQTILPTTRKPYARVRDGSEVTIVVMIMPR